MFDVRQKRTLTYADAIGIAESISMLDRKDGAKVAVKRAIRSIEDRCGGEAIPEEWLPEIVRAVEIGFPAVQQPSRAGQCFR